jgi:hypothetical protein
VNHELRKKKITIHAALAAAMSHLAKTMLGKSESVNVQPISGLVARLVGGA